MLPLRLRTLTFVASLAVAACAAFEPDVGALRHDAAVTAACSLGASGYSTGLPSAGGTLANAYCTADGGTLGSPCDVCEAASCCSQRVACYSDNGCSRADSELDPCTSVITDGGAAATLACWGAFAKSGAIAQARYDCLRASCASQCGIPTN